MSERAAMQIAALSFCRGDGVYSGVRFNDGRNIAAARKRAAAIEIIAVLRAYIFSPRRRGSRAPWTIEKRSPPDTRPF